MSCDAYIASPMSQITLQPFSRFTYVTAHSLTLSLPHLCHSSFSNPSAALPTSQLILQTFRRFTYVTAHSTAFMLLHLRHRHFTYVTCWIANGPMKMFTVICSWWFCNLQWLWPAGLYERCKLALELKRLKSHDACTSVTSRVLTVAFAAVEDVFL